MRGERGTDVTGAETFDYLCRKAGLPTEAEHLAAVHQQAVEDIVARYEWDRQVTELWASITIRQP